MAPLADIARGAQARRDAPAQTQEATIRSSAAASTDAVYVSLDKVSGAYRRGPCYGWQPRAGRFPQQGDKAIVARTDTGELRILTWWGAGEDPSGGGGGGIVDPATPAQLGTVKLSTAAADAASPVAVSDTDPRNSNARAPTPHTHSEADVTGLEADLASKAAAIHTHAEADVTGLEADLAARELTANKGAANGYAPLDSGLLIPVAYLPDATGAAKGVVKLTGDLAGSAAAPVVAPLAITDAKVAAANKDGAAATPSMRTLGAGAAQAMPGNRTLDAIPAPVADVGLANHKLTSVLDPTAAQDAATKNYVDTHLGVSAPAIGARVYNSANLTIPNNSGGTVLAFDSERYDTDTIHDTVSNTSRLTCRTAGLYAITGSVNWATNVNGFRQLILKVTFAAGGSAFIAASLDNANGAVGNQQTIATEYQLAPGDYVQLLAQQSSGGALDVAASANFSPEFSMVRIPGAQGTALGVTSSLPPNPVDGQECYFLADATNGIVWHLKYRAASASAYKWEGVGEQAALVKELTGNQLASVTNTTYTSLSSCTLAAPLAGDYDVTVGGTAASGFGGAWTAFMAFQIGAGGALDDQALQGQVGAGASFGGERTHRVTGVAAAAVIAWAYRQSGTTGTDYYRTSLRLKPVRVG